jgi:phospholipid/cholesterol/gamma-HCH transport system substrate-binding protein
MAFKAALLMLLVALLLSASVAYLLYARGAFERTQQLVLIVRRLRGHRGGHGHDLLRGCPIGRVNRIELSPEGNARIHRGHVPRRDAHWLRAIQRVHHGKRPGRQHPHPGLQRRVDRPAAARRRRAAACCAVMRRRRIPRMVNASVRDLLANLQAMTAADSPLNASLARACRTVTRASVAGPRGALGLLLGNEADARKLITHAGPHQRLAGAPGRRPCAPRLEPTQVFGDLRRDAGDPGHRGAAQRFAGRCTRSA